MLDKNEDLVKKAIDNGTVFYGVWVPTGERLYLVSESTQKKNLKLEALMRSYIDAHMVADREWTDEIQNLWEEMADMVKTNWREL